MKRFLVGAVAATCAAIMLPTTAQAAVNPVLAAPTFGLTDDAAYRRSGLSSMNGKTDTGETVTPQNFRDIVTWANSKHLARVSFWAVNRDRGNCGPMSSSCSGINQQTYEYTLALARFTG